MKAHRLQTNTFCQNLTAVANYTGSRTNGRVRKLEWSSDEVGFRSSSPESLSKVLFPFHNLSTEDFYRQVNDILDKFKLMASKESRRLIQHLPNLPTH